MAVRTRIHIGLAVALVLYAVAVYGLAWSNEPGGAPDTPVYLLMADWFAALGSSGGASEVARRVMASAMFPPLHPLLLSVVGGSSNTAMTHALSVTWLLAALAVAFCWMREQGLQTESAAALIAAFALSPATLLLALESLSENLYLLLSLLHLLALSRALRSGDAAVRRRQLGLAACWLGLALLTRSVGGALLAGFAIALYRHREPRRALFLLAAVAPLGVWVAAKWRLGFSGSYASAFASKLASYSLDPIEALGLAAWAQVNALGAALAHVFALHPTGPARALAWMAGLAAVIAGAARLRRLAPDAVYAIVYVLMIAAWPFPAHAGRFLYVLLPVLLLWMLEGVALLAGWLARDPQVLARVRVVTLAVLVAAPLPSLAFIAGRFAEASGQLYEPFTHTARWYTRRRLPDAVLDARFRQTIAAAQAGVAELVPADACVWATDPFELSLRAGRVAYGPPPASVDAAAFDAYLERCSYFFLSLRALGPYAPFYPRQRLGGKLVTLASFRGEGLPGEPVVAELSRVERSSE